VLSSKKIETWHLDPEVLQALVAERRPMSYADLVDCVYLAYSDGPAHIQIVADKNNYYINHLEDLPQIWNDASFIHLVRDGRDVACSYLEVGQLASTSPYKPRFPKELSEIAREWSLNVDRI